MSCCAFSCLFLAHWSDYWNVDGGWGWYTHRNFILKVELCTLSIDFLEGDEKLPILFSSTFNFRDKLGEIIFNWMRWLALFKQIISLHYYDTYYLNWNSRMELKCERNLNRLDFSFGIVLKPFRNRFDKSVINKSFK